MHIYIYRERETKRNIIKKINQVIKFIKLFINNLQNLHIYMYIYYLCIFFVIWLFKIDFQRYVHPDTQKRFEI